MSSDPTPVGNGAASRRLLLAAPLATILALGWLGTLFGAMVAAFEVARLPPVLVALGLLVLRRGVQAWPAALGWCLLGALLSTAAAMLVEPLLIVSMAALRPMPLLSRLEAVVLLAVAWVAWNGTAAAWLGPLLAASVALSRTGLYAGVLVLPFIDGTWSWDTRWGQVLLMLGAGFLAGLAVVLLAGLLVGWAAGALRRPGSAGLALATLAVLAALPRLAIGMP